MLMAIVLLMAIAILLAFYCNFDMQKISENYIRPLLIRPDQLTKFVSATNNNSNSNSNSNSSSSNNNNINNNNNNNNINNKGNDAMHHSATEASSITILDSADDDERDQQQRQQHSQNDYYHARQIRPKGVWDIPGPKPLPLVGTKWIFMVFFQKYKMSTLHEVYADLNRKYGDIVLEVMPSGIPIVHLFNRQDLEKVLKYPSKYPFRPPTEIVVTYRKSKPERYASVGIVNEQGPTWQKLRSSLTSYITSPRILQNFLPALNLVCDDFIDLLKVHRDPNSFEVRNFEDIANLMGLEAVCTLMLGRRMGFLSTTSEQPEKIKQLAAAVKQLFISQRDSYYGLGLWKYFPTKCYRDFARAEETIYDIVTEMVDKALEDNNANFMHHHTAGDDDDDMRSVFLHILELKDLDIRDKKSAIIDFIAAGIETLANTILFVLSSVTSSPQAVSRILEEFRDHKNSLILQDAFTNATYTKACIQESYRIRPTAFCLARILEEDMQLSGHHLKAGTVVLCQNMIACSKDVNFTDAKKFHPERWIDREGNFTVNIESSTIVVPFGIGKRTCPGKRFVEMEIVLLLAKLLLAFDITFTKPLETEFEFLLAPKTPLSLQLRDRVL